MFRTKFIAALVICASCLVSCKKTTGPLYSGEAGFAFASGVLNVEVVPEDEGLLQVPLYRGDLDINNAKVHFEYDIAGAGSSKPVWCEIDPDGVFSLLSGKVMFSDISYRSYAKIQYGNVSKLGFSKKYRMRLYLDGQSSPSHRDTTIITVSRKLTFEKIGDCTYYDHCIFERAYKSQLYKARECEMYRVMDPYTEALITEEYASAGLMQEPPAYVQFECDANGHITYEAFHTGMLVPTGASSPCMAWVYYPSTYKWGKDFSRRDVDNIKISDKHFQLCGVFCLPDFKYGFLDEGAYTIDIELTE